MKKENIFESMAQDIMNAEVSEKDRKILLKNLQKMKEEKINIMVTGATGCGKSSTINALFETEVAKVGVGVDPETMEIEKYELENLVLWDSPGLGDGKEADNRHAKNIIRKLSEVDKNGSALIDLVLVILDGSSRDLGTSYELINNIIIPNLGPEREDRILVAINQADMAMKGRNWDYEANKPNEILHKFLEEKVNSVKKRIQEATGVKVEPIYYSAGFKEEGMEQCRPYNLSKLLYYIVTMTPMEKRAIYVNNTNNDTSMWENDDGLKKYGDETRKSIFYSVVECARKGGEIGAKIGGYIFGEGSTGQKICKMATTVPGILIGAGKSVLRSVASWFGF